MDYVGLSRAMDGLTRLAYVGMATIAVLTVAAPIGLIAAVWWAYNHVSIH